VRQLRQLVRDSDKGPIEAPIFEARYCYLSLTYVRAYLVYLQVATHLRVVNLFTYPNGIQRGAKLVVNSREGCLYNYPNNVFTGKYVQNKILNWPNQSNIT